MDRKKNIRFVADIILRILLIGLSLFMIAWYLDSRIFSFGTLVGIGCFGVLIALCLTGELLKKLIRQLWQKKTGKILVITVSSLAGAFVVYVGIALSLMMYGAAVQPAENATVVLLGCQVRGTTPSLMLTLRMDTAYDYLVAHPEAKCICSGGKGSGENISEASCMFRYLTDKGIPPERLYIEDRSSTTEENIRFSREIIQREGLSQELAIVTDWYHEYRASLIAGRQGLSSGAVSSPTPRFIEASLVTREVFAIAASVISGS